ncbi:RHS repeat protein, partial [Salmonella enterica]
WNLYNYPLNPVVDTDPLGLIAPVLVVIGAIVAKAATGAAIDIGVQAGSQILGQMKDNWDNDRDLLDIDYDCIDINWWSVGASAAFGTVAPGLFTTAKKVRQSVGIIRSAGASELEISTSKQQIAQAIGIQAAWQSAKYGSKKLLTCIFGDEDKKSKCKYE